MTNRLTRILIIPLLFLVDGSAFADELKGLHPESKQLAYCANSLAYAGNYYLIQNNIGLAKFLLFHHARTYGALLYINQGEGTDPRRAIGLGKAISKQVKKLLERDIDSLPQIVDDCIENTIKLINENNLTDKIIDGTNFGDFVESLSSKNREQYGL